MYFIKLYRHSKLPAPQSAGFLFNDLMTLLSTSLPKAYYLRHFACFVMAHCRTIVLSASPFLACDQFRKSVVVEIARTDKNISLYKKRKTRLIEFSSLFISLLQLLNKVNTVSLEHCSSNLCGKTKQVDKAFCICLIVNFVLRECSDIFIVQ